MQNRKRLRAIDRDVQQEIVQLFQDGHGAPSILTHLQQVPEFQDRIPGIRTLQRMVKDMRKKSGESPELDQILDRPFEWHKIEQYGLPWEAGSYVLRILKVLMEMPNYKIRPVPTGREARWWWRVHLADLDLNIRDVYALARAFSGRELAHFLLGVPEDMSDIEALLVYGPWKDERTKDAWVRAINEERIPTLKSIDEEIVGHMSGVGLSVGSLMSILNGYQPHHFMPRFRWVEED